MEVSNETRNGRKGCSNCLGKGRVPAALTSSLRLSGQADMCGHRSWSTLPAPPPGSPWLCRPHYEPVFLVPLDNRTVPQRVIRPGSSALALPEGPRAAPSGEIIPGILQI